ncbi:MAG TPA: hypothetical protein VMA13_06530 [Candidatus Saccharimonadales bacterium]|nr:hypothetical protein [Candidatus Saccharimonadales bacterium]
MNLGKLLVAGKSVMGGRRPIAYHITNRNYLPKFIPPKNPFAPPVETEVAPKAEDMPEKKTIATDRTKTQKLPAFFAPKPRGTTWVQKLNPISILSGSNSERPQKAQCPRQAELSLDRVKVVHNDLTDVDVEIVPIKSRTSPELEAPMSAEADHGHAWSRLSAKIFGTKVA